MGRGERGARAHRRAVSATTGHAPAKRPARALTASREGGTNGVAGGGALGQDGKGGLHARAGRSAAGGADGDGGGGTAEGCGDGDGSGGKGAGGGGDDGACDGWGRGWDGAWCARGARIAAPSVLACAHQPLRRREGGARGGRAALRAGTHRRR